MSQILKVQLPNGEYRLVAVSKDLENHTQKQYYPMKLDKSGYGVSCESLDNAINHIFQTDCNHNVIINDATSNDPRITPLPYKCTICDKYFIYWNFN